MAKKIIIQNENEFEDEVQIEVVEQTVSVDQQDERPGIGYEVIGGD